MNSIALTNLSQAGGCGCKQNEKVLSDILCMVKQDHKDPAIIVDFKNSDDCAVYDLNAEEYLLITTDFFTPIVDDPYVYGVVSASNALSDVYAMGGKPILANTILGYPRDQISPQNLEKIIRGGTETLNKVGCSIVGGHTIENPQPFYGFTVLGTVPKANLKKNIGAQEGDVLILTKPLGIGIYANALKLGLLEEDLYNHMITYVTKVNTEGYNLGTLQNVHSMTDITGFGLIGHALELCQGQKLSLELFLDKIPLLPLAQEIVGAVTAPQSGLMKNYQNYKEEIETKGSMRESLPENIFPLFDPQSNGGLLIAVQESALEQVITMIGTEAKAIGRFVKKDPLKKTSIVIRSTKDAATS